MKKLVIAASALLVGFAVNAATCQWISGALYVPAAGGGNSSTTVAAGSQQVNATLIHFANETAYNAMLIYTEDEVPKVDWAATSQKLYKEYKAGNLNVIKEANNKNGDSYIAAITVTEDTTYVAGNSVYGAIIYETTTSDGDFYIANMGQYTWGDGSNKKFQNMATYWTGDNKAGSTGGWQAVPEPTSGLLLLLGVAGLALRRRRA